MSTFIALQFSKDVARTIIRGMAYIQKVWLDFGDPVFFDEHGTGLQRYYNSLCLAYGADPELMKDLPEKDQLPEARRVNCQHEYEQVKAAFVKTVLPFVNRDQMKRVQAMQWLRFSPDQLALLNQQQKQQKQTFSLALCNRSTATSVNVVLLYRPPNDPDKWQVEGWYPLPDGGCQLIGSLYGDRLYWYAMGNGGKAVWSAPDNDANASTQCIDPRKAFRFAAGSDCGDEKTLVRMRRVNINPTLSMYTLTLQGGEKEKK
jgi:uncharacterized membrane protein